MYRRHPASAPMPADALGNDWPLQDVTVVRMQGSKSVKPGFLRSTDL
jgi:hypothetical protein